MQASRLARTVFVVLAALAAVVAAAAEPSLEVRVPDAVVSVGDRVPVKVTARGGEGWLWGELQLKLASGGPWEVVDGPRTIIGSRPPSWELTLVPMEIGEEPIPELGVSVRPPEGEPKIIGVAQPPVVTVASVLPPEGEADPSPMRDPLGVRGFPWEWLVPILIALLPALALQHWWLRRRGTRSEDVESALPPMEQLELLAGELREGVGRTPVEELCDRLAGGFRRFLERRTGEPAQEMTSFELRGLARSGGWPDAVQHGVQRIMGVVDGVRFGRRRVAEGELQQAIDEAVDCGRSLESFLRADEQRLEEAS
jgi:hypothetical protein